MHLLIPVLAALTCAASLPAPHSIPGSTLPAEEPAMYPTLAAYLEARAAESSMIDDERRSQLDELARAIVAARAAGKPVRLNFICTHNSRRSHMGQLFAAAAAQRAGIAVTTYSGGTESTAFNPRAVAAVSRAGFRVEKTTDDENPIYHARTGDATHAMTCFSKRYDQPPNPKSGFIAVLVCTEADGACPSVTGADDRFAIPYIDPKIKDNTPEEASAYDERAAQIAREMIYVMSKAAG